MKEEYYFIGDMAGKIYAVLESKKELTVTKIQKELKVSDPKLVHQAIGWLAREEKISFGKKGNSTTLTLA